ncbi:TetR/AcrR family transcriptional regulator [Sinimarinibacterium thermocellulolyticum]|uniref:Helix-turn-helix domain-containing protein n=1 Tax=Sinimarinibacterium thermocellulolyticum TaxID=3170016 RepID=A0ABV2ADK3_9GAMM
MGRPGKQLISRERAARAALGVIDVHGLDALSLELVAQRMGVKAPSLYYHFKSKAEILSEVARLLLLDVKLPKPETHEWRDAIIELNLATRRSILQHPNAAPLLLQFFPRHLLLGAYNHWISTCPLPVEQRMILIEGLERLTFGSALFEAACRAQGIEPMPSFDREKLPHLAEAVRSNRLDQESAFVETLSRFLDGFGITRQTHAPAPRMSEAKVGKATHQRTADSPRRATRRPPSRKKPARV